MSAQPRKVVHPDIKPENTPELASRYLDVPNMPWERTKFAGIRIKVLYSDDRGMTTALFKLDPGAVVPLHEHTALEQTFVLEGTIEDHEGVCGPGQFVWRPAGNQHEAVAPNEPGKPAPCARTRRRPLAEDPLADFIRECRRRSRPQPRDQPVVDGSASRATR